MAFEAEPGSKNIQKPLMLKDFLLNSSSSNGFVSIPRLASTITVGQLLEIDLGAGGGSSDVKMLPRSSSRASSALRRASETLINAVKHIPFYSIMSQSSSRPKQASSLTRSLSQKLKRRFWKTKKTESTEREIGITVTDVTRWESCEEEENASKGWLESSNSSCSWLESDSSSETAAQSSSGSSEYFGGNEGLPARNDSQKEYRSGVGEDSTDGETKNQEQSVGGRESLYGDKEQLSPVSVLDRHTYEDGESSSPALPITEENYDQIHQKVRRLRIVSQMRPTNFYKQSFQSKVEEDEEYKMATAKAKDLLNSFRATNGKARKGSVAIDRLMLDFFREGLVESKTSITPRRKEEEESMYKEKLLRAASIWMTRDGGMALGVEDDKEAYVQGMEDGGGWRSFAVEEEELVFEIEASLLVSLLEELMLDVH